MQSVLQEYQAGQIQYISSKETEKTLKIRGYVATVVGQVPAAGQGEGSG